MATITETSQCKSIKLYKALCILNNLDYNSFPGTKKFLYNILLMHLMNKIIQTYIQSCTYLPILTIFANSLDLAAKASFNISKPGMSVLCISIDTAICIAVGNVSLLL